MRPRLAVFLAALLGIALVSCANLPPRLQEVVTQEAPAVPTAQRIILLPPAWPEIAVWWQQVEACTGKHRDVREVTFALWADTVLSTNGVERLLGVYVRDADAILVVQWRPDVVRHEMAHALIRPDSGHPAWVGTRCAALFRWP